jgi:hypothetical protein
MVLSLLPQEPPPALPSNIGKYVVINTMMPSSQLKKKYNAVAYHQVQEAIAT